jgi:hypothetical protein
MQGLISNSMNKIKENLLSIMVYSLKIKQYILCLTPEKKSLKFSGNFGNAILNVSNLYQIDIIHQLIPSLLSKIKNFILILHDIVHSLSSLMPCFQISPKSNNLITREL